MLEFLKKFELTVNTNKAGRFGTTKSSPPPPEASNMEILLSYKYGKHHWSNLDWLLYKDFLKDCTAN